MSTTSIIVKMQSDGTMVRIKTDGTEEKVVVPPVAPLSDEAVTEAALRDPDAQPLTDADLARMKRVPRVKTLRRAVVGYFHYRGDVHVVLFPGSMVILTASRAGETSALPGNGWCETRSHSPK